jgi:hypothetical protein
MVSIVLNTETADTAHIGHALLEGREAAIHGTAHAAAVLRAPGIVLRFGWSAERGCRGGNAKYKQQ